jgi:hypothetical protein
MSETPVEVTAQPHRPRIDELLAELRVAGPDPKPELLEAIRTLGPEGVTALIAMVTDPAEYEPAEDDEAELTGWAPYIAIEILGEMHPLTALEPLLSLLAWDDYDYLSSTLPDALARFGRPAFEPVTAVLADRRRSVWMRIRALSTLERMVEQAPELRDEIVARLTAQLDTDEPDTQALDALHGFLVAGLVNLKAHESAPAIVRAFEEDRVDLMIIGGGEVLDALDVPDDLADRLEALDTSPWLVPPLPPPPAQPGWRGPWDRGIQQPYVRETPKVGRNDPCPCGSGKKYKKCHGG